MKKLSFIPSILLILTIMTLGLTSCTKKYGCYYGQNQEMKTRNIGEASKWTSTSGSASIDDSINTNNCSTSCSTVTN